MAPRICHIVLMQINDTVAQSVVDDLMKNLEELCTKGLINGLLSFTGGKYSSPEGFNKGLTHGFTMVFESSESRDAYLPHPEHERVRDMLLPLIENGNVLAFDYELPSEPGM